MIRSREVPTIAHQMVRVMSHCHTQAPTNGPQHDPWWLESATRWWASESMVETICAAAPSFPEDYTMQQEDMLDKNGIVLFAQPISVGFLTGVFDLAAIHWIIAQSPDEDADFGINIITWRPDDIHMVWPISTYSWVFGDNLLPDEIQEEPPAGGVYDRIASRDINRYLSALFVLARQENISQVTEQQATRAEWRRAQRAGLPLDPVRIIDVRRAHRTSTGNHHDVEWSHRWIVRGHWRQQPVGPGRTQRRPTWVPAHVKGPDDKPLVVRDTVHVLR